MLIERGSLLEQCLAAGDEHGMFLLLTSSVSSWKADLAAEFHCFRSRCSEGRQSREYRTQGGPRPAASGRMTDLAKGRRALQAETEYDPGMARPSRELES